jgi:hypothetical protein
MFYRLINNAPTPNARRAYAGLTLLFFPLLLILAIIMGTVWHLIDFVTDFFKDVRSLGGDVKAMFLDLTKVLRTGGYA